jgi:hypothetical protein
VDLIRIGVLPKSDLDDAVKLILLGSYRNQDPSEH